ncbi:fumarylacetoacetate hydrolase family protein, partial [Streptomyces afghaniensis]|uniref:fumarylacetoacetate hydrolase family protein n=1 Tax=Streptomyces afghaniensis TaxID=66865 RepID=UPI002468415A
MRRRIPLEEATLVAPLGRPRAVWGVGLNYVSKAARTGRGLPEQPILYLAASSGVSAPGARVVIPQSATEPDYEGEIAVVVGRRLVPGDRVRGMARDRRCHRGQRHDGTRQSCA